MRHVIQLTGPATALVALCDDGTMWTYKAEMPGWVQLLPLPGQPGTAEADAATLLHDRLALERQERAEQARRERFLGKTSGG
jgi:hypothetical protein